MAEDSVSLQQVLRDEYKKQEFVSLQFLERHITSETVKLHLRDTQVSDTVVQDIIAEGKRLFAILVLLERAHDVSAIFASVKDHMLPFSTKEGVPPVVGESPDQISAFWNHQAKFPPRLRAQLPLREFPSSMRPPFVWKSGKQFKNGSYGQVFKVKVAEGHVAGYGSDQVLALKIINTSRQVPWDKCIEEVKILRARQHDNIVSLLACWVEPPQESSDKSLNLLFPLADTDMKEWMNATEAPSNLCGDGSLYERKRFLYETVISLLSALSHIHSEIDGSVGLHHDLKPSNILLFDDRTWKICDFGKSGLKSLEDGSETEGKYGLGSRTYQPPEYANSSSRKFGRAFDVWAMGCIIIELAILLVYGWETKELEKFTKDRTRGLDPNAPFHENMSEVLRWIKVLECEDGSSNICFLMRTACAMTHGEREARLYSWEAYLDLHEQMNPNDPIADRRRKMEKLIQRPKDGPISTKENPRSRTGMEKNSMRDQCLARKGWPEFHSTSPEIQNFLDKSNSKPERADIVQLFLRIYKDYLPVRELKSYAKQFAKAVLSPHIPFSEVVDLLQQSLDWPHQQPFEHQILRGMVDVNRKDDFDSIPLFWVSRHGNAAAAKLLLNKGATIDFKDPEGYTPLAIASTLGHTNVVKLLLEHGGLDVNSRGHDQRTPLLLAVPWGHVEVAKALLDNGADPQLQDPNGRTAVSIAASCANNEVLKMILDCGRADPRTKDHYGRSPLMYATAQLDFLRRRGVLETNLREQIANVDMLKERDSLDEGAVEELVKLFVAKHGLTPWWLSTS